MNASSHALTRWPRCTLGGIRKGHIKPGFAMSQSTTTEREGNAAGATTVDPRQFKSFAEFYPFYLGEHSNTTCRRLHFIGTSLSLGFLLVLFLTGDWWYLLAALVCGYGFAWVGHFGFEKNRPASFKRPLYSFRGDWMMWRDILLGRIKM